MRSNVFVISIVAVPWRTTPWGIYHLERLAHPDPLQVIDILVAPQLLRRRERQNDHGHGGTLRGAMLGKTMTLSVYAGR
jgi:hypothetical protein